MDKLTLAKERTDDGGGGRRVTMDHKGHDLHQKELHQGTGTERTPKNELRDEIYEGSP